MSNETEPQTQPRNPTNPLVYDVQRRLWGLEQNWLAVCQGGTGTGKSYTAMSLALAIDPSFTAKRVYFGIEELLHDINNGKLSIGKLAVLDEAGVVFSSRKWFSEENNTLSNLLQCIRHRRFGLIFTLPNLSFLDITGRKLIHATIETVAIDRQAQQSIVKWKNARWSDYLNKLTLKFPVVKRKDGKVVKVERVRFDKPPQDMIKEYERKKLEFTTKIAEEAEASLRNRREAKKDKEEGRPKQPTKRQLIEAELRAGTSVNDIVHKLDTKGAYVRQVKADMPPPL